MKYDNSICFAWTNPWHFTAIFTVFLMSWSVNLLVQGPLYNVAPSKPTQNSPSIINDHHRTLASQLREAARSICFKYPSRICIARHIDQWHFTFRCWWAFSEPGSHGMGKGMVRGHRYVTYLHALERIKLKRSGPPATIFRISRVRSDFISTGTLSFTLLVDSAMNLRGHSHSNPSEKISFGAWIICGLRILPSQSLCFIAYPGAHTTLSTDPFSSFKHRQT